MQADTSFRQTAKELACIVYGSDDEHIKDRIATIVGGTRKAIGWTERQLAQFANAGTQEIIQGIENKTSMPQPHVVLSILSTLNVPFSNAIEKQSEVDSDRKIAFIKMLKSKRIGPVGMASLGNECAIRDDSRNDDMTFDHYLMITRLKGLCNYTQDQNNRDTSNGPQKESVVGQLLESLSELRTQSTGLTS